MITITEKRDSESRFFLWIFRGFAVAVSRPIIYKRKVRDQRGATPLPRTKRDNEARFATFSLHSQQAARIFRHADARRSPPRKRSICGAEKNSRSATLVRCTQFRALFEKAPTRFILCPLHPGAQRLSYRFWSNENKADAGTVTPRARLEQREGHLVRGRLSWRLCLTGSLRVDPRCRGRGLKGGKGPSAAARVVEHAEVFFYMHKIYARKIENSVATMPSRAMVVA